MRDQSHILPTFWPDPKVRAAACRLLADSIMHAHKEEPGAWVVTLLSNAVRLSVGQVAILTIRHNDADIYFRKPVSFRLPHGAEQLYKDRQSVYSERAVRSAIGMVRVPLSGLRSLSAGFLTAHCAAISSAAEAKRRSPWKSYFSEAALRYLEKSVGEQLPRPDYVCDGPETVAAAPWNHPGVRELAKLEPTVSVWLPAEEADQPGANDDANYSPQEGDRRQVVERQIRERRGQQYFRNILRERYGDRCLVTGCEVLAVLEAAHIKPYRGADDNHPENGLLLRADIHTLFDLDLLGLEPVRLRVELHPDLTKEKEYGNLAGKTLVCSPDRRPSLEALRLRYEQFQQRVHRPA